MDMHFVNYVGLTGLTVHVLTHSFKQRLSTLFLNSKSTVNTTRGLTGNLKGDWLLNVAQTDSGLGGVLDEQWIEATKWSRVQPKEWNLRKVKLNKRREIQTWKANGSPSWEFSQQRIMLVSVYKFSKCS